MLSGAEQNERVFLADIDQKPIALTADMALPVSLPIPFERVVPIAVRQPFPVAKQAYGFLELADVVAAPACLFFRVALEPRQGSQGEWLTGMNKTAGGSGPTPCQP